MGLGQVEKLQDIRVLDHVERGSDELALVGEREHSCLVTALEETLEEQRMDLTRELPSRPPIPDGLDLIEIARFAGLDTEQRPVVSPRQPGVQLAGLPRLGLVGAHRAGFRITGRGRLATQCVSNPAIARELSRSATRRVSDPEQVRIG